MQARITDGQANRSRRAQGHCHVGRIRGTRPTPCDDAMKHGLGTCVDAFCEEAEVINERLGPLGWGRRRGRATLLFDFIHRARYLE